jgi:tetratricopeptide (TPR) repeat protein
MHDLLRRYARDRAAADPAVSGRRAVERLLDYYQYTAARADALIALHTQPGPPLIAPRGLLATPDLDNTDQALAWARADRASLLACLDEATRTGQHARAVALTAGIAALLRCDGPWADAITRFTAAAQDASRLGDRLGQANALTYIGSVRWRMGDYPAAFQVLEQALEIYRDLGNLLGQANALLYLGVTLQMMGDYQGTAQALEQALEVYRDLGDRLGQANVLYYLGRSWITSDDQGSVRVLEQALEIYRDRGYRPGQANALLYLGVARRRIEDHPGAAQAVEQALEIYRDTGIRGGEAAALNQRGELSMLRGEFAHAEGCHRQALELAQAMTSFRDEAHALAGLGRCAMNNGHVTQAEALLRQALEISQRIGAAEARDLLAEVNALTGPRPAG